MTLRGILTTFRAPLLFLLSRLALIPGLSFKLSGKGKRDSLQFFDLESGFLSAGVRAELKLWLSPLFALRRGEVLLETRKFESRFSPSTPTKRELMVC